MKDFLLLKKDDFIVDSDGNAKVIDKDKNANKKLIANFNYTPEDNA